MYTFLITLALIVLPVLQQAGSTRQQPNNSQMGCIIWHSAGMPG